MHVPARKVRPLHSQSSARPAALPGMPLGRPYVPVWVRLLRRWEDREASSGGDPSEKATAPTTETCERKEHVSPKSYRKAGTQHAVEEYGRRELEDRELPESFREAGCPESFCSGTVAKHAVEEHGYSDLQECESSAGLGETFASELSWSADGANFGSRGVFLVSSDGRISVGRVQGPAVLCCRLNPICA